MLLNQWLRHWVPADHLVHLIIDVVAGLDLSAARVNKRDGVGAEATSSNAKSSLSLSHSKIPRKILVASIPPKWRSHFGF